MHILMKYIKQESFELINCAHFMTRLEHTNIIIDDFSIAKHDKERSYTYILTHIHTDHLKGLNDNWRCGPIYCTEETKALLLYKFPNIPNVRTIPLQTPTRIQISDALSVNVTFFDANHCIGAVMVLIQGYMGTILYTGDMRFDQEIFKKYRHLYPPSKLNQKFEGCSKHIDILYLDNTFLKKKFDFPPKDTVLRMLNNFFQQLVEMGKHSRVYIGLDTFGKQEVLVQLATHFDTPIVVDEKRFEVLLNTPLDIGLFSTSKSDGVIQVVRKNELYAKLKQDEDSIGIILSGWVNQPTYRFNETIYCLPYSLHSNYKEIHTFVKSIKPSFIYPIVREFPNQNKIFYAQTRGLTKRDLIFNQNLFEQQKGNYQAQIQELRRLYTTPPTEEFKILNSNIQLQKQIYQKLLNVDLSEFLSFQKTRPLHMQTIQRKRYQLPSSRNELQINRLKNQIELKKKLLQGEKIEMIDEDQDQVKQLDVVKSKIKTDCITIPNEEKFEMNAEVDLFPPILTKRKIRASKERKNIRVLGGQKQQINVLPQKEVCEKEENKRFQEYLKKKCSVPIEKKALQKPINKIIDKKQKVEVLKNVIDLDSESIDLQSLKKQRYEKSGLKKAQNKHKQLQIRCYSFESDDLESQKLSQYKNEKEKPQDVQKQVQIGNFSFEFDELEPRNCPTHENEKQNAQDKQKQIQILSFSFENDDLSPHKHQNEQKKAQNEEKKAQNQEKKAQNQEKKAQNEENQDLSSIFSHESDELELYRYSFYKNKEKKVQNKQKQESTGCLSYQKRFSKTNYIQLQHRRPLSKGEDPFKSKLFKQMPSSLRMVERIFSHKPYQAIKGLN